MINVVAVLYLFLMFSGLQDGLIHVLLRELPSSEGDPPDKIKIELAISDTGKVCS